MSDKEALEKVIQRAIEGGWDYESFGSVDHWLRSNASKRAKAESVYGEICDREYELIFSHDFAKALWGDGTIACYNCTEGGHSEDHGTSGWGEIFVWQHHLQQLAIAEDRIKYLRDNALKENTPNE